MKKEDWINRILNSHQDIKYDVIPEKIFPKILEKINDLNNEVEPYAWLKIAAILVVAISLTHNVVSRELKAKSKADSIELIARTNNMIYK